MALYSGRLLMRGGNEADFDPDKMMPREWAVSTDKKIVRICFAPGVCIRMATYDAFEEDMEKIEEILATCQSIQEAVIRINTEISQKADVVAEYTAQAKQYRDEAKQYRDEAEQFSPEGYSKLLQTATETKERVDVLEENMETISSGVEALGENLEEVSSEVETNKNNIEKVSFKVDTVIEKADLRIKETASGESIHLNDSADGKVVEFGLYGKVTQKTTTGAQLLNYDAWKNVGTNGGTSVFENNGVTITATSNDAYTLYGASEVPSNARITVNEGDIVTLSWEETNNKNISAYIFPNGKTSGSVSASNTAKSLTYTVPSGVTFVTFRFGVRTAGETISYKNIMINKGSTPLPYEKYTGGQPSPNPNYPQDVEVAGSSGNVVVKSVGSNLLNYNAWKNVGTIRGTSVFENNGVTITATDNSCYTDYPPNSSFPLNARIPVKDGDTITLSWEESSNKSARIFIFGCNESNFVDFVETNNNTSKSLTYTVKSGIIFVSFRFAVDNAGETISYKNIMINKGSVALPYEPYKETSSTIQTSNGLAGIAVESGGNYTDSNGQQWVCDEVVKYADGSGEYVQRIKSRTLNGTENWFNYSWGGHPNVYYIVREDAKPLRFPICSHYQKASNYNAYTESNSIAINNSDIWMNDSRFDNDLDGFKNSLSENNVIVYYELSTPIRTPLTAEQIAEIEKLCTFYPVTHIFNDADCGMKATYIVDAKKYIDNKIAELATAMINNI